MMAKMERAIKVIFLVSLFVTVLLTKEYIVQGTIVFLDGMRFLSIAYIVILIELILIVISRYMDIKDYKEIIFQYESIREIRKLKEDVLYSEKKSSYQKSVFNRKIVQESEEFLNFCKIYRNDRTYKRKDIDRMSSSIEKILEEIKLEENDSLQKLVTE